MTPGILFALAIAALAVALIVGLVRRSRMSSTSSRDDPDAPNTVAQWTEGETTRLLSSAELPGLYLVRPRFLTKAEGVVFLLLRAAFPRHEIFARVRLSDVLQVKIGPQGMERLRAFRKIANQHVGFVDLRPRHDDRRDRGLEGARPGRQSARPEARDDQAAVPAGRAGEVHLRVPAAAAALRELREQILGPAARPRLTSRRRNFLPFPRGRTGAVASP